MLVDLLRIITPEQLVHAIKSNPSVVQAALQKFEAYSAFGNAITIQQQLCISNNLDKLNGFFKSEQGRDSLSILADEFVKFISVKT